MELDERTRRLRAALIIVFVAFIIAGLIYSRISAYSLAPTIQPQHLQGKPLWEIPFLYIWDYLSHAWICLLFAFVAAGLVYEFIPKEKVTKYMASNKATGYLIAVGMAPFFTVCSCTMVPLFAGILFIGAGIGPAIAFLLMAPAANILTILLTGEILGWDIAVIRIVASMITAIVAGLIISRTSWGKKVEKDFASGPAKASATPTEKRFLDERLIESLRFGASLAKRILPLFFVGLVAVSYVEAFLPSEAVATYLTGPRGVMLASVIGGPLYTPTLVEIVLGRSLVNLGMSKAALLAWLMGQPYDIPNMAATSRVVKWPVVLNYALIAWFFSVTCGLIYGVIAGVL